ncbi:MAG: Uma2 family endonuclease [Planctomycetota bacterium]
MSTTAQPVSMPPLPPAMPAPARFTLDHYEHLVACGAFESGYEKRVELLWGTLTEMAPIGPPHADNVDGLMTWSVAATANKPIRVRIQQPIRLPSSESEPEPGISWVKEQSYAARHPNPDEVLLVIEVADTSLETDRGPKLAAYAEAGIAEYWIVNRQDRVVEVCRSPSGRSYDERRVVKPGEPLAPLAAPDAGFEVATLFAAADA